MNREGILEGETQLNDELVEEFVHGLFGYGNLDARLWFVGMEEGGGDLFNGVAAHLEMWAKLGKGTTLDIRESGQHPDRREHAKWFIEHPNIQKTWSPLIRLLLAYRGEEPTMEAVRTYQRDELARADGNECLLELLPLPSPSTNDWHYPGWSSLSWLRSRQAYRNYLLPRRVQRLRSLVNEHQPEAVIFYSKSYIDFCCAVAGCEADDFREVGLPRKEGETLTSYICDIGPTTFAVTYHPTYFPATNLYFESVGRFLTTADNGEHSG